MDIYPAAAIWPAESGKPAMVAIRGLHLEPMQGVIVIISPGDAVDADSLVAWAYPDAFRSVPEVIQ